MICGGCRAAIPDHVKFCPKCGAKAEAVTAQAAQTKRCPVCGTDNPLSAKFCKAGGHPLPVEQAPSVAPPIETKESTDALSCPKCGTSYPVTAKFCRNDGTPLKSGPAPSLEPAQPSMPEETAQLPDNEAVLPAREEADRTVPVEVATQPELPHPHLPPHGVEGIAYADSSTLGGEEVKVATQPDVVEVGAGVVKRPSRSWLWPIAAGVVLLLVGGAGYLYYAGSLGKNPAKVQMKLDAELKAQGLDDIYVEVSKDWVATVSGFVENEADKGRVLGIVESNNDVKDVEDRITVATAKGGPAKGVTESPSAQSPSMWTGEDSSAKGEAAPQNAQQPPSMRHLEEALKQGTFE